jgi:hypothetical protein
MPDPDHSRNALTASPASPAPPEGPFWTFWEAVAYVDLRDPENVRDHAVIRAGLKREQDPASVISLQSVRDHAVIRAAFERDSEGVREAPPADHLSPGLRQAIAKVREAIRGGTLCAFEFRDIDGVTGFCEAPPRRWRDPTNMVVQGFASLTGDLNLLDRLYDGILLSVADVMAFPAPDEAAVAAEAVETTEVIETTAPAEKTAPIMSVVTTAPFTPKEGKEFYRGQIGVAKNRPAADIAARAFFGPVPNKLLDEAAKAAGFVGKMGRPKKVK